MPSTPSSDRPADPDPKRLTARNLCVVVLAACALGLISCLAMGAFGDRFWVLDLFNHFYVQYVALSALGLVASLLLRSRLTLVLFGLVLGLTSSRVAPLVLPTPQPSIENAAELRIVALNVKTANTDYARGIQWLLAQDADVLILQETGQRWVNEVDAVLRSFERLETNSIRDDNFGISVYVKSGLAVDAVSSLGIPATVPWIDVTLNVEGRPLRLMAVHTIPPMGPTPASERDVHLQAVAQRVLDAKDPLIVAGDLNATIWSKGLASMLKTTGLKPASFGQGLKGSWPSSLWFAGMILIDHVLTSDRVAVKSYGVGQAVGSDHRGIVVDVLF